MLEIIFSIINLNKKTMKRKTQVQKLDDNKVKVTLFLEKIDSIPGKVNNTYQGKGKMSKFFQFAVRDEQDKVLTFVASEQANLSALLLSLSGEKLEFIFDMHNIDDVENPVYELIRFENLSQTLESLNHEVTEMMEVGGW